MAECICGCGRAVSRFPLGIRTINKRGKLIRERLEWARAHADAHGEPPGRPEWLASGEHWIVMLRAAVHGEPDPDDPSTTFAANRAKPALDGLQTGTNDWMREGRAVEALVVPRGAMPIKRWLKQRGPS